MFWAKLIITDGTTTIDLLRGNLRYSEWLPQISEPKGGGVWKDSPLTEGRQIAFRRFGNVIETLKLQPNGASQEDIILATQDLRRLLEQALDYWVDRSGAVEPVWIEARANCETNSRYAYIYDYRTPQDGDPYGPWFNTAALPVSFGEWQLMLERGHWLSSVPGTPLCAQSSGSRSDYTYGSNLVLNGSFETAGGGGADVFANWTETAGDGTIARTAGGPVGSWYCNLGAGATANTKVQQNIAVAAGSRYVLSFQYDGTSATYPGRYAVLDITHATNIIALTALPYPNAAAGSYKPFSVSFVVPSGCVSVGIVLQCSADPGRAAYFDYVNLFLATSQTFGRSSTCTNEIFLANHYSPAQLTHAFRYDDSAAAWSANLITTAVSYDLLPNPMAAPDCLYIGVDDAALYPGPFSAVIFSLSQQAVGTFTAVWEAWTGAAWAAITTYLDTTLTLSVDGVSYFVFNPLSTWAKTIVNGIYGYWIRLRVTAITGGAPRVQQASCGIYVPNWPNASISAAQIGGDISALMETKTYTGNPPSLTSALIRSFLIATRRTSRGSSFQPWLNWSEIQPPGVSVTLGSAAFSFVANPQAPTGRCVQFVAGLASSITLNLDSTICNQYFGAFRIIARVKQTAGAAGVLTAKLSVRSASEVQSPVITVPLTAALDIEMIDFGLYQIPSRDIGKSGGLSAVQFNIEITPSAAGTLQIYDLLLIPVDECVIQLSEPSSGVLLTIRSPDNTHYADIDSIDPKQMINAMVLDSSNNVTAGWSTIGPSPFQLYPNSDQRIYFFVRGGNDPAATSNSYPYEIFYPQFWRVARFLSMRGTR
jgi:hypothetical protein